MGHADVLKNLDTPQDDDETPEASVKCRKEKRQVSHCLRLEYEVTCKCCCNTVNTFNFK